VLADLDATRAEAYLRGDQALLEGAYAAGAPAGDRDAASLAVLIEDHRRVEGLSLTPTTIAPLQVTPDQAVLRVVDTMAPHVLAQTGTGAKETKPGRGERTWTVILHRSGPEWLVWDVLQEGVRPAAAP
jgi:hypothetical protein